VAGPASVTSQVLPFARSMNSLVSRRCGDVRSRQRRRIPARDDGAGRSRRSVITTWGAMDFERICAASSRAASEFFRLTRPVPCSPRRIDAGPKRDSGTRYHDGTQPRSCSAAPSLRIKAYQKLRRAVDQKGPVDSDARKLRERLQKYLVAIDAQLPVTNPDYDPTRPAEPVQRGGKNKPAKPRKKS
jgi:hypothetical protein